jgi:hypothetical protein
MMKRWKQLLKLPVWKEYSRYRIGSCIGCAEKEKQNFGANEIVVLTVSGRGDKDMETYIKYFTPTPKGSKNY